MDYMWWNNWNLNTTVMDQMWWNMKPGHNSDGPDVIMKHLKPEHNSEVNHSVQVCHLSLLQCSKKENLVGWLVNTKTNVSSFRTSYTLAKTKPLFMNGSSPYRLQCSPKVSWRPDRDKYFPFYRNGEKMDLIYRNKVIRIFRGVNLLLMSTI